jgi:uncharacterized membrane protein
MAYLLKLYGLTLVAFFAIDLLWLGVVARSFYRRHLGFMLAPHPNWWAAILFYLLFVAGVLVFVVMPSLQASSWTSILLRGAFFGLVTYAAYDLTNQATAKDWPVVVTVVDMIWGSVLTMTVATIGVALGRWLNLTR